MNADAGGTDCAIRPAGRCKILIRVHLRSSAAKYSCLRRQPVRPRPSPGRTPTRPPTPRPSAPARKAPAATPYDPSASRSPRQCHASPPPAHPSRRSRPPVARPRPAASRPAGKTGPARSNALQPENRRRRTSEAAGDSRLPPSASLCRPNARHAPARRTAPASAGRPPAAPKSALSRINPPAPEPAAALAPDPKTGFSRINPPAREPATTGAPVPRSALQPGPTVPSGQSASRSKIPDGPPICVHPRQKYCSLRRQLGGPRPSPGRTPSRHAAVGPAPPHQQQSARSNAIQPERKPIAVPAPCFRSNLAPFNAQPPWPPIRSRPRPCLRKPACHNPMHLYAACHPLPSIPVCANLPARTPCTCTPPAGAPRCPQKSTVRNAPRSNATHPENRPPRASGRPPAAAHQRSAGGATRARAPLDPRRRPSLRPGPVHTTCRAIRAASSPRPPRWTLPPDAPAPTRRNPTATHPQPPRQRPRNAIPLPTRATFTPRIGTQC
jgi:hypothetical protein